MDLDDKFMKRMEGSLADDEIFKDQVKKLEQEYGPLIGDELREKFHLEKQTVYARENQKNLEEMVKRLVQVRELSKDTLEIVNEDTFKLQAAFEQSEKVKTHVIRTDNIIDTMAAYDLKKKMMLFGIIACLGLLNALIFWVKIL